MVSAANCLETERNRQPTATQRRCAARKDGTLDKLACPFPEGLITNNPKLFEGITYDFAPDDLKLFVPSDDDEGFVHWVDKKNQVFSCLVVPKAKVSKTMSQYNCDKAIGCLEALQVVEKNCKRGKSQTGKSTSKARYTIFGTKVLHGKSFSRSRVYEECPLLARDLEFFAGRLEHVAATCIPSSWLRGMKKAGALTELGTIGRCSFGCAIASLVDYCAPSHVDDDFFLSVHQLNVEGCYNDSTIVQYFCFPSCGYAVGLRPGDVLLFNPHVHHCLSRKSAEYADKRVHVSTLYVKNRHVGKNDRSATLTEEEEEFFNCSLKFN